MASSDLRDVLRDLEREGDLAYSREWPEMLVQTDRWSECGL